MFVTLEVSKLSGWLNTDARQNMEPMSLTLDVSKLSGWLNAPALRNIWYMVVTPEVSQLETSAMNQDISGWNVSQATDMRNMFRYANAFSDANKLSIRCAWAGTSAFASAGYGSSWVSGNCASPNSPN